MRQADLVLLHPPSVYDFRRQAILYGPVSDLIPSSPVFEMYPLGFLTITNYLEARGIKVRIANLALRMMNDRCFDVPSFISRLKPRAFGIDLHWLPHTHGALEVAKIVKRCHPGIPVIMGGLSASYFHDELIRDPHVDFVLRGDAVEEPLEQLLQQLGEERDFGVIPNLTWKEDGKVHANPMSCIPSDVDYVDLNPLQMVRMVLRYRDLQSVLPFNGWWQNPITAVFNVKGCLHQCQTCGSSAAASQCTVSRYQPAFRSPKNMVNNIQAIARISRGPIFVVGDINQAGADYAAETIALLHEARITNEIVFEMFSMPSQDFLPALDAAVKNWSLELSPESHDEIIRSRQDGTVNFSNAKMEALIHQALALRCHRVDVFFMIGLAGQTTASVYQTIDYCKRLFAVTDKRLSCFISPMGPFLDPGSHAFENPEASGYRVFARTLEEHRQRLLRPSWRQILNYETDSMTRDELVEATYAAAERLNELKLQFDRIDTKRYQAIARRIVRARELENRLNASEQGKLDPDTFALLQGEINEFSVSTVCDKQELFWRRHVMNFRWGSIARQLLFTKKVQAAERGALVEYS